MLKQLLVNGDENGLATPATMQISDADLITDQVTDQKYSGQWRPAELSTEAKQRICDAINAELGGATKAAERVITARAKEIARKAEAAERIPNFGVPAEGA
jgi:hypothetical protein